jgi:hypothetical protein
MFDLELRCYKNGERKKAFSVCLRFSVAVVFLCFKSAEIIVKDAFDRKEAGLVACAHLEDTLHHGYM